MKKLIRFIPLMLFVAVFAYVMLYVDMPAKGSEAYKVFKVPKACVKVVSQDMEVNTTSKLWFMRFVDIYLKVTCETKDSRQFTIIREVDLKTPYLVKMK